MVLPTHTLPPTELPGQNTLIMVTNKTKTYAK